MGVFSICYQPMVQRRPYPKCNTGCKRKSLAYSKGREVSQTCKGESSMNNFSRLKKEHANFFTLPKLPYVIGTDKAIVLAIDKQISDKENLLYTDRFSKTDIVQLYNYILGEDFSYSSKRGMSQLEAYSFVRGQVFEFPVDYEKNFTIINSLQADEYAQLVRDMEKYLELEKEFQSSIS